MFPIQRWTIWLMCNPRQVCNSKDTCYIFRSFHICIIVLFLHQRFNWYKNHLCPSDSSDYIFRYDNCLHIQNMKNYRRHILRSFYKVDVDSRRKLEDSMHSTYHLCLRLFWVTLSVIDFLRPRGRNEEDEETIWNSKHIFQKISAYQDCFRVEYHTFE